MAKQEDARKTSSTTFRISSMDENTTRLLEESFVEVAKDKEAAAALFYERLFALDPSLRGMFTGTDMRAQQMKLMAALGLVVGKLRMLGDIVPVLEGLAVK